MHRIVFAKFSTFITLALACCLSASLTQAQTTAFTYQGRLADSSLPANGSYDFQFKLFDAASAGTQIGSTLAPTNVAVSSGIFTVSLDFGTAAFPGANRWLEIGVRTAGGGAFTTLAPRQPITTTPYAIKSLNAAAADGLSAACVNCVSSAQIGSLPANSSNYIQNTNSLQASSNFRISGNGTAGGTLSGNIINATTQFTLGDNPILGAPGSNVFVGIGTATNFNGPSNSLFGYQAGFINSSGSNNTLIGAYTNLGANNLSFATALGAGAVVTTSNAVVLGRSLDTVNVPGALTIAGTLTANGSALTNLNAASIASGTLATARGGTGLSAAGNAGNYLRSDGTNWTSSALQAADIPNGSISSSQLSVPITLSGNQANAILSATNSSTVVGSKAIEGISNGGSSFSFGVFGQTSSSSGRGVSGNATSSTGPAFGVEGRTDSNMGRGVYGAANSTTGTTYGVYGTNNSTAGIGVYGFAASSSGAVYGVVGENRSDGGGGVQGKATNLTGTTSGVYGENASSSGTGVFGFATNTNSGINYGVRGVAAGSDGTGVYGETTNTTGVTSGVWGKSASLQGAGVRGEATSTTGFANGVIGVSLSTDGAGVKGVASKTTGQNSGVIGLSFSSSGTGVYGGATSATGLNYGVEGKTNSLSGVGVRAAGAGAGGTALQIETGAIKVLNAGVGTSTPVFIHRAIAANISGANTTIDHPLTNGDPNAILIITPNFNPGGGGGIYNNHQIGVTYDGSHWRIFNQDNAAMPVNSAYNVLIVKP